MVHINQVNKKKHLIQFPISIDLQKVRKLAKTPCPTVLLKADTGADVNLLNLSTFDKTIGYRSLLQPLTLWMEAYGNSMVSVLGKFCAFLRWKGRVYKQMFYIKSVNASPNLLSRDSCYMLGVLKPCYSVKTMKRSAHRLWIWQTMEITRRISQSPQNDQSVRSNYKEHHWRKWTSLRFTQMYSPDLGNFQALHTNSNWSQMQNWQGTHWEEFQFTYKRHFIRKSRIWNI